MGFNMMHNPPHPGQIVKRSLIEALGLTVIEAALLGCGQV
jgi:plasmid maintenance system antidote protein VapI